MTDNDRSNNFLDALSASNDVFAWDKLRKDPPQPDVILRQQDYQGNCNSDSQPDTHMRNGSTIQHKVTDIIDTTEHDRLLLEDFIQYVYNELRFPRVPNILEGHSTMPDGTGMCSDDPHLIDAFLQHRKENPMQ